MARNMAEAAEDIVNELGEEATEEDIRAARKKFEELMKTGEPNELNESERARVEAVANSLR